MARWVLAIAAALLVVLGFGVGYAAGTPGGPVDHVETADTTSSIVDPPEGPALWIRIELTAEGHAEWSIESRFNVSTEPQAAAFDALVDDVRGGTIDIGYDREVIESYRDEAAMTVDRSMEIRNIRWTDRIEEEDNVGVLAFEFTWTNFANASAERVILGDVFTTPEGTWLEGIDQSTRLTIDAPSGYAVESSPPDRGVENGRITWDGPTTFEAGEITVTYLVGELTTDDGIDISMLGLLFASILLLALLLGVGYRRIRTPAEEAAVTEAEPPEDPVDEALLSDEERVERLLADHGGRMKQAVIVEETGWSNAKVSQLLSSMAENGRVEKLRLGRENLISLPEEE